MIPDYSYQPEHIERIVQEVSRMRCVLAQLPTGGGKTREFILIAKRFYEKTGKSVLILVHREELLNQAFNTCFEVIGIHASLITSKTKKCSVSRVYIAMVDSVSRRLHMMMSELGLIIIDECHINNFIKIHNLFLEELIIGFTATPISSKKTEPLNKYYKSIVCGPQISELIKCGSLAQNLTWCPKEIIDHTQFQLDKLKGDYNEQQMFMEFSKTKFVTNVIKYYKRFCDGKKTIVFNVSIDHSKLVNDCFNYCGIESRHLDSNSPNRKEILEWFHNTPGAILCNVMIATVGFDEPTIESVILNFSTLSLVKFIQCSGRGSRGLDWKKYFDIIDMGGNHVRFGDWCDDRDWEYIFNHPPKPGDGVAPVKTCPNCDGLVHASSKRCGLPQPDGSICEYEFERTKSAEEQDMEEVIMVTKGIDLQDLQYRGRNKYQLYPMMEMAIDVIKSMYENNEEPSYNTLIRYFGIYYDLCCQWWNKFMSHQEGQLASIKDSTWHMRLAKNNFNKLLCKYKPEKIIKINDVSKLTDVMYS